jgi:predicted pyridoxine 5'-phosphate oxidase superfamily flavin-nucleotide-binding protein
MTVADPRGCLHSEDSVEKLASKLGHVLALAMLPDSTLLIPDSPGNNRLDSLQNLMILGQVGLLFFIPGVDETLRINGAAVVSTDPEDLAPDCMAA